MSISKQNSEDSLQKACADYMRLQYPKSLWCHVPNGGNRNAVTGAILKSMGTKKGVPDLLIFDRRGEYSGLAIELKVIYKKQLKSGKISEKPNEPSPEQLAWLEGLYHNGWRTHVVYSFDSFKSIVDEYFGSIEKIFIPEIAINMN